MGGMTLTPDPPDAPVWMSTEAASGWASGWAQGFAAAEVVANVEVVQWRDRAEVAKAAYSVLKADVERLRDERDQLISALNSASGGPTPSDVAASYFAGQDSAR